MYSVSALTEFCGLSFQLEMLLCVAAGTAGLLIQAEFGLTQTAGRHLFGAAVGGGGGNHSGDAAVNLEFVLRRRVEPTHFTFTSLNPPPQPPTSQEATSREVGPKHDVFEGLQSLLPPLLFFFQIQSGPAAAASGTTFRPRWLRRPSPAAPSPSPRRRKETRGALAASLVDGEAE